MISALKFTMNTCFLLLRFYEHIQIGWSHPRWPSHCWDSQLQPCHGNCWQSSRGNKTGRMRSIRIFTKALHLEISWSEVESLWLSASQGHTPVNQRAVLCCGTFKNGPNLKKRFLKTWIVSRNRNSLDRVSGNTSEFHRTLPSIRRLQWQTRMAENSLKTSVSFPYFHWKLLENFFKKTSDIFINDLYSDSSLLLINILDLNRISWCPFSF